MAQLAVNVRAYLVEVRLAVFGSTNRDGSAHLTGMWYELRDDAIILNTGVATKKVRNLRRDPRGSVCVIDHAQARHVTVDGTVTFDEDHVMEDLTRLASSNVTVPFDEDHVMEDLTRLASRYAGTEAGPRIAENIARIPHITLKLSIDAVRTFGKI